MKNVVYFTKVVVPDTLRNSDQFFDGGSFKSKLQRDMCEGLRVNLDGAYIKGQTKHSSFQIFLRPNAHVIACALVQAQALACNYARDVSAISIPRIFSPRNHLATTPSTRAGVRC